jgi:precorrin-2/cobalt-factor-2 C20-methyltransferase
MPGTLIAASLGPGDPGLITRAAWSALESARCWAWPITGDGASYALSIVTRGGLEPPPDGLALHFPMTRDPETLALHWAAAAEQVLARLHGGEDVVFLVEGDASTFSTFGHLARGVQALDPAIAVRVIPGVPSYHAAAAAAGAVLVDGEEPLAVYSAPEAMKELDALLERFDALVLLKVRPVLDPLIEVLTERSLLDRAVFVERVGTPEERILHDFASLRGSRVHYLSLILIRQDRRRGLGVGPS